MSHKQSPNYRKPPREHQFPKGISGNPKGRPKKEFTLEDARKRVLEQDIPITQAGKRVVISGYEALWRKLFAKAMEGDTRAAALILRASANNPANAAAGGEPDADLPSVDDEAMIQRFLRRQRGEGIVPLSGSNPTSGDPVVSNSDPDEEIEDE